MSEHGAGRDASPDTAALRRRVLLAGAVSLAAFVVLGYVLTAVGAPPWTLLPSLLVVVVLVVRPLMAPVLAADRERRRRAAAVFRAQRSARRGGPSEQGRR